MNVVLLLESLGKLPGGAHEQKCRSKLFERNFTFKGVPILIKEDLTGDVGEIVWEMCLLLMQFLEKETACPPGFWRGKRVIELGAGTGLLGIALALLGAEVVVTDIPPVLELLEENVRTALESHPQLKIQAAELDWFKPVPEELRGPWEYHS